MRFFFAREIWFFVSFFFFFFFFFFFRQVNSHSWYLFPSKIKILLSDSMINSKFVDIRIKVDITWRGRVELLSEKFWTERYFSCHYLDKRARGPNETQTHTHAKFSIDKTSMTRKSRIAFAFTCETEIHRACIFSRSSAKEQLESEEKQKISKFPKKFSIPSHRRSLIFFSLSLWPLSQTSNTFSRSRI